MARFLLLLQDMSEIFHAIINNNLIMIIWNAPELLYQKLGWFTGPGAALCLIAGSIDSCS